MVTVKAEAGGEMDMATVTINVTDMNDAPMFAADMDTRSVAENTAAGENVGDPVMAVDEDEGDTLTYALGGDDADSFMIDGETGQISVGEGTELDFESDMTTYTVTVTATDGDGLDDMITVTITVTNVNDQMPMFADDMAEFSVAENAAAGTVVGMVMADDDSSLMYSDDSMYFDVDPETGQIMVAEGAMLDYEMEDMHTVTVTASDGESSDSIMVTIMVTDMNEAPMFAADTDTRSVAENTAAGENVGDPVTATDPEDDALTYTLGGDDAASFAFGGPGQITVGEGTELDFESDMTTYTVTVTATDGEGLDDMVTVTINVTDMNEAPMFDFDMAEKSVAENTDAGENIGDPVAAMDVDADDTLTYTLGGEDMDSFDIDSATGQLMTSADLDYETEDSYSVTVTATDSGGLTAMVSVTISVTDVVETMCSNTVAVGDAASAGLVADCEALLRAMPKLLGSDSTRSLNWDVDTPIADWDGVRRLSESGRVEWLYLHGVSANEEAGTEEVKLNGTIAVELGDLDGLTRLYLHRNNLTGGIPAELSNLNNLVWLRLYNNQLSGEIPDLSGMASLERLYIHENDLSGEIPMSLGSLSSLTHMRSRQQRLDRRHTGHAGRHGHPGLARPLRQRPERWNTDVVGQPVQPRAALPARQHAER